MRARQPRGKMSSCSECARKQTEIDRLQAELSEKEKQQKQLQSNIQHKEERLQEFEDMLKVNEEEVTLTKVELGHGAFGGFQSAGLYCSCQFQFRFVGIV